MSKAGQNLGGATNAKTEELQAELAEHDTSVRPYMTALPISSGEAFSSDPFRVALRVAPKILKRPGLRTAYRRHAEAKTIGTRPCLFIPVERLAPPRI